MWFFKRKPAPGEIWVEKVRSAEGPWPHARPNLQRVKIVDVKKLWVRYQWESWYTPGAYIGDPWLPLGDFVYLYEPTTEQAPNV